MNAHTIKIATAGLSLTLAAFGIAGCSGGGSKGSLKKFCADYITIANSPSMQNLLNDDNNGDDVTAADPADKQALQQVAKSMQKLANDAPGTIRAEAQTSAKDYKKVANGKADETVQEAGSAAGDHVDTFAQDQCPGATSALQHANATPTTVSPDSFGPGSGTSSVDNGSDNNSYNGSSDTSIDNGSDNSSYNDNSSDTSIDNGSDNSSCDYSSIDC